MEIQGSQVKCFLSQGPASTNDGYLWEYSIPFVQSSTKKYFVLKRNILSYRESPTDFSKIGAWLLGGVSVCPMNIDPFTVGYPETSFPYLSYEDTNVYNTTGKASRAKIPGFSLQWADGNTKYLICETTKERDEWVNALQQENELISKTFELEKTAHILRSLCLSGWRRYRIATYELQKLKAHVENRCFAARQCDIRQHDRLCKRIVELEEMLEIMEARLTGEGIQNKDFQLSVEETALDRFFNNCATIARVDNAKRNVINDPNKNVVFTQNIREQ